jgi:primosomal protein N' (replication factor Y)
MAEEYLDVAVELPLQGTFCYRLPPALCGCVQLGSLVWVPFGHRQLMGIVVATGVCPPEDHETKEIMQVLEEDPPFSSNDLVWYRWASRYYLHPLGRVFRAALPPSFRRRTRKRVMLTPAGQSAVQKGLWKDVEAQAFFEKDSSCTYDLLVRRYGKDRAKVIVDRWRDRGWVEFTTDQARGPAQRRRYQSVALSERGRDVAQKEQDAHHRLGRKQIAILRYLAQTDESPVASLESAFPGARASLAGLRHKGLVDFGYIEVCEEPLPQGRAVSPRPLLTGHQRRAFASIEKAIREQTFHPFLLWGVTGSGKTEIYLCAAEACLAGDRQVIVLVPEISLTHQLVREFMGRFGSKIAILHSRLSAGERSEMWRAIQRSDMPIVLGARSALFAPCRRPGLIIVDEEHDGAYKQEDGFRYHARDLALMRGKITGSVVVLGSATPSLESYSNAQRGKLTRLSLPERVEGRPMPRVEIIDLKQVKSEDKRPTILSPNLQAAISDTLARQEQVLLFLNRRGYATFLLCTDCGYVLRCTNCAVTLVYHRSEQALRCHYCNWTQPAPALCPSCRGTGVIDLGLGTETLEEAVRRDFPAARVLRMDRDTTSSKHASGKILRSWRKGEADILIGTQMVAKGHHVPNVTLVGVVLADISLNLPDFRAAERTFQLMLQVAGRAGRGENPGRVIIQTYQPSHPSIHCAAEQDYPAFAKQELSARRDAGYPPFRHLVLFRVSGPREQEIESAARLLAQLTSKISPQKGDIRFLGPAPAPLAKLKGRYRWHLLLKGSSRSVLNQVSRHLLSLASDRIASSRVRLTVDVDPQSFL